MKSTLFALRVWLLASVCAASILASEPPPSLNSKELGDGPYSTMHMLLERTFLKVDVLTLDVRFSKQSQARFAELAQGKSYSAALSQQIAQAAIESDHAVVQLRFLRDVALEKWMDVVRENLDQARNAGLVSPKVRQRVIDSLPKWFAPIRERGYEKGDRLMYEVRPDSLRTVVVAANGKILVDQNNREAEIAHVVLASYYAPGSEFREPLIRSRLKSAH